GGEKWKVIRCANVPFLLAIVLKIEYNIFIKSQILEAVKMKYISPKEAAEIWGISQRRVTILCSENRIVGVTRVGNAWLIPKDSDKPIDARRTRYSAETRNI
ncbi:MAG: helix-turn-helix domain-containing protein, partial [Anaerovoracaceae bacterium]